MKQNLAGRGKMRKLRTGVLVSTIALAFAAGTAVSADEQPTLVDETPVAEVLLAEDELLEAEADEDLEAVAEEEILESEDEGLEAV
ncbi:hypothetical protein IR117_14290, partial [Streptococcus danieliae]|nr:hypothetical protein [Streptococcus danieliae]